ncbi:SCC1 / RAD21 FAMILY MEMBER [Salix viminalis]|uniref:SCC1 / RAD21 FAMILY MEMBER n=1 Tax=Salix viminalis TaxID=40686 RepID=A0A9Q0Z4A7_SALVM|nr:SCC1 / RAD21 FAMILY MEMBER [Salix viminalis]
MFYSQFILAKKGPLGTIWIAAHLERKLRKNQVADTDIGVSVDSILFPDVPIALRLSSHLLLGVVRIYSRKVNYLFDDCSEALLKVKQAFRSTDVDLPPEESTAPYHSITLPETFDLDDFELPDNDIFQGNYVDHHISTREQITLQDTMDGVVYSTSQFGLDERFGDGDTSHVGLDLEEDLFLAKAATPRPDEVLEVNLQTFVEPADPKVEEDHDMIGCAEAMPVNGIRNKMVSQASNSESLDYAQAPSTPGLIEEPNLSSVQDGLACDDHLEPEDHNLIEVAGIESTGNASSKSDLHQRDDTTNLSPDNHLNYNTAVCMPSEENGCLSGDLEISQAKSQGELQSIALADGTICASDGSDKLEVINNAVCKCRESTGVRLYEPDNIEIANAVEDLSSLGKTVDANTGCPLELAGAPEDDAQACQGPANPDALNRNVDNEKTHTSMGRKHSIVSGISTKVQGEECYETDGTQSVENQISEPNLHGEIQVGGKQDEQPDNAFYTDNQLENMNSSLMAELPSPEKLLSVPQKLLNKPNGLLVESTPDKEMVDGGDRSSVGTIITGKKRCFTESSLTVQSLNSVDSFGVSRSKRTADSIPDDDDLLSSILVGRRSSVLKMKPTPPAPEVASMKRTRSVSRPSAMKRKVLMDDSMVLLGDTIRHQLTNTEDIRRLRKKAPCTRTEILTIQRQSLDEEIFSEPVLTGMSAELTCLLSETFDLSRIDLVENDDNNTSEAVKDSSRPAVAQHGDLEASTELANCRNDVDGQPAESPIWTENQQGEDHHLSLDFVNQGQMNAIADVADYRSSEHETLGEITEMDIDKENAEFADAANHTAVLQFEGSHTELISCDAGNMLDGLVLMDSTMGEDGSLLMNTSILPSDMMDTQFFEEVALRDVVDGKKLDDDEILDHHTKNVVAVVTEFREGGEILLEENKAGAPVEVGVDIQADGSALPDKADILLANMSLKTGGCIDLSSVNVDQTQDDAENDKLCGGNEDGGLAVSPGHVDKYKEFNHPCNEDKIDSAFPIGLDCYFKNASLNYGDYLVCQEADQERTVDAEITSADNLADLQDVSFANDTEFLNVDDDEMGEDNDDGMPGPENAHLLDNSGWSSRTRAVAKYLQTIFDNEGGNARKVISVDNLLAGKTRKEASRMFFETLVLKTRDYIHVEQLKPFDSIIVKPRAKLMKSDF